jgi:TonB-linked SusC/RagA family outer membrane protein
MRISLFFLFFGILFSSAANSFSQEFIFKQKSVSIREICRQIEKESDYVFVFSDNSEKMIDKKVNIDANAKNVAEILDAVLSNTGLTYEILDKQIVIYESGKTISAKVPEHKIPEAIIQQPPRKQITGRVVDAQGEAIIGANIIEVGTTNGTVTDVDGNFTLSVEPDATIRISYIGYLVQNINTTGKTSFNIILQEDTQALEELVVTALGITKDAKKLGYAVSSITSDDLTKAGATNLASGLYGKAAGIRINSAPGSGTSAVSISVRGLSSITGNTQPLVIMDGVPIRNENTNNNDYWSNQRINSNGIVDINPEDIENITILKGAAASALYGSEASNGVVMITTKKGKKGAGTQVNFSAYVSYDKVAYMPEIQKEYGPGYDNWVLGNDNEQALTGFRQTRVDRNGNPITTPNRETIYSWGAKYDPNKTVTYFDGNERAYMPIDHNQWEDIFRTGVNQTYNLSLTNATERNNVRFAYTFNDVLAMQYNSNNHKHNFNLNGTFDITKNIKLNYTATYLNQYIKNRAYRISRLTNNYSGMFGGFTDVAYIRDHTITSLGYLNSIAAINGGTNNTLTPDEQFLYSPMGSTSLMTEYFWNIFGKVQEEDHNRFISSVNPTWEIISGLTLSGRIATDLTTDKIENKNSTENAHIFSTDGHYSDYYGLINNRYQIVYGDIMLMFDKTFAEKHNITASSGWNGRQEIFHQSSVGTSNGLTQENWFHLAASVGPKNADMSTLDLLRTGMFLTAGYGYNGWGFLESSIRQEKTSTLKKGNNSFWYPSISTSFLYTELLKDKCPNWWDYGKIRASYGVVGNAPEIYRANNAFQQGALIRSTTYTYNYVGTAVGNDYIKPETKYEFEIGIENKFFNNRLGMELNYYYNDIKDQILTTTAAASMGGRSMLMNVGELSNEGVELSVYGTPYADKDWRWDVRANIAWNRNEVKKLAEGLDVLSHLTVDNGAASLESHVGEPMGDWYVYTWKKDDKGNYIVGNDGLYIADKSERHKVGNAMPKSIGGFGTSLSWKNLTLDATFDFRIGGNILNLPWQYMMDAGNITDAIGARDYSTGGIFYYSDTEDVTDKSSIHILSDNEVESIKDSYKRGDKFNGHYLWDNGVIQKGVKEDGTPNDIIVTQFEANDSQYGWGTSASQSYQDAIQENTYFKCREISLAYTLPVKYTEKFACNNLTLSAFVRNPFYIYRSLKLFDAETPDATNWIYQAQVGGSTASARTFGLSLRASF